MFLVLMIFVVVALNPMYFFGWIAQSYVYSDVDFK